MPMQISSTAPVQNGRERRASAKAKAICLFSLYMSDKLDTNSAYLYLADAVVEKANNKRETAQKSAERSEKRSRKKAKTAEIERRRNQENERMYFSLLTSSICSFFTEPSVAAVPISHHQDAHFPSVEQDPGVCYAVQYSLMQSLKSFQFTVQDIPLVSKAATPRLNLVPQRGAVPRPPLATALSSARNRADARTDKVKNFILQLYNHSLLLPQMPAPKKLTPETAHYLLELREKVNNGSLHELQKQINGTQSVANPRARHGSSYSPSPNSDGDDSGDNGDNDDPDFNIEGTYHDNNEMLPQEEIEDDDNEDDNINIDWHPTSPQAGQKRSRHDSDVNQLESSKYRKAIKVKNSRGKPKADDWESEVQDVLAEAILSYETRLATLGFFPDHMQEVTWAKAAWLDGCRECGVKIHHNTELIKIVWIHDLPRCGANNYLPVAHGSRNASTWCHQDQSSGAGRNHIRF
jgi:hypothetical protein